MTEERSIEIAAFDADSVWLKPGTTLIISAANSGKTSLAIEAIGCATRHGKRTLPKFFGPDGDRFLFETPDLNAAVFGAPNLDERAYYQAAGIQNAYIHGANVANLNGICKKPSECSSSKGGRANRRMQVAHHRRVWFCV